MQEQFKQALIGAIENGDYRFLTDKLGNNYLAVVPKDRTQIDFLQLKKSHSFIRATRDQVVDKLFSDEMEVS